MPIFLSPAGESLGNTLCLQSPLGSFRDHCGHVPVRWRFGRSRWNRSEQPSPGTVHAGYPGSSPTLPTHGRR